MDFQLSTLNFPLSTFICHIHYRPSTMDFEQATSFWLQAFSYELRALSCQLNPSINNLKRMFHLTLGGILPAHRGVAPRHLTTIGANTSDLSDPWLKDLSALWLIPQIVAPTIDFPRSTLELEHALSFPLYEAISAIDYRLSTIDLGLWTFNFQLSTLNFKL